MVVVVSRQVVHPLEWHGGGGFGDWAVHMQSRGWCPGPSLVVWWYTSQRQESQVSLSLQ